MGISLEESERSLHRQTPIMASVRQRRPLSLKLLEPRPCPEESVFVPNEDVLQRMIATAASVPLLYCGTDWNEVFFEESVRVCMSERLLSQPAWPFLPRFSARHKGLLSLLPES